MKRIGDGIQGIVSALDPHPIETEYLGTKYRSRLEARWSVFFHHAQIQAWYEYEGFALPSGRYLPDFWLPELGCFFEVKPEVPLAGSREFKLAFELAESSGWRVYVSSGPPWTDDGLTVFRPDGVVDSPHFFCECPECGRIGIEYEGLGDRICGERCCGDRGRTPTHEVPRFRDAMRAAKSTRFWEPV
jgi:hypothetical protein